MKFGSFQDSFVKIYSVLKATGLEYKIIPDESGVLCPVYQYFHRGEILIENCLLSAAKFQFVFFCPCNKPNDHFVHFVHIKGSSWTFLVTVDIWYVKNGYIKLDLHETQYSYF